MPTSEERYEVAARLRDAAMDEGSGYACEVFYARLSLLLFGDAGLERTDVEVFDRLAELIDPTCGVEDMELTDECDEATPYTLTLSCGHIMGAEHTEDIPAYCPVCGARVVGADGE
jgi:23S rRNA G2069 N7-methylase RlmK/C1962 C5-methylase RlmI